MYALSCCVCPESHLFPLLVTHLRSAKLGIKEGKDIGAGAVVDGEQFILFFEPCDGVSRIGLLSRLKKSIADLLILFN